jgi:hypothetical protein
MILFHGVNIDDWRHLYFIYPSFILLGMFAVNSIPFGKWKIVVITFCVLQLLVTGMFMIRNHPYQQVYFNNFVSHDKENLRNKFDLDYWGVAYKQGIDYIVSHDTASVIQIHVTQVPEVNNTLVLPKAIRKRIVFLYDDARPGYFITNFRMHPNDYNYPNIFYEIKVLNSTILRVYKIP